jgi:hypothetical protein
VIERKVILIDVPNVTSEFVSLNKVCPGEAQCCLLRHEVTLEHSLLSLKKSMPKILRHRG